MPQSAVLISNIPSIPVFSTTSPPSSIGLFSVPWNANLNPTSTDPQWIHDLFAGRLSELDLERLYKPVNHETEAIPFSLFEKLLFALSFNQTLRKLSLRSLNIFNYGLELLARSLASNRDLTELDCSFPLFSFSSPMSSSPSQVHSMALLPRK